MSEEGWVCQTLRVNCHYYWTHSLNAATKKKKQQRKITSHAIICISFMIHMAIVLAVEEEELMATELTAIVLAVEEKEELMTTEL